MLNSLVIKNFRCLEDFEVSKLGRVNLIVGKNNSGKSTVLEALRIYASNANFNLLKEIAESHDEDFPLADSNYLNPNLQFPYKDLFLGREPPEKDIAKIIIGESIDNENTLYLMRDFIVKVNNETTESVKNYFNKTQDTLRYQTLSVERESQGGYLLKIEKEYYEPMDRIFIPHSFIPTKFIAVDELAKEWDKIVYTEHEKIVSDALKIILPSYEHLVFVENENANTKTTIKRIPKVKLSDQPRPIPLKSLGDGMLRVLQLAIKLVSAQGGFLLIDEFENGLHYSIQEKIWSLLFEMAEKLDIQVFATTHSWDCIESFAKVANDKPNIEGVLFRMGKSARKSNQGQIIATVFDNERLYNLTQADVEVR
jgi:AAA15 family ATPase/GTPase